MNENIRFLSQIGCSSFPKYDGNCYRFLSFHSNRIDSTRISFSSKVESRIVEYLQPLGRTTFAISLPRFLFLSFLSSERVSDERWRMTKRRIWCHISREKEGNFVFINELIHPSAKRLHCVTTFGLPSLDQLDAGVTRSSTLGTVEINMAGPSRDGSVATYRAKQSCWQTNKQTNNWLLTPSIGQILINKSDESSSSPSSTLFVTLSSCFWGVFTYLIWKPLELALIWPNRNIAKSHPY